MGWVLKRTVGAWSAGTRVEIVDFNDGFDMLVRVLAGDKPLIDVVRTDLVEQKKGVRIKVDGDEGS